MSEHHKRRIIISMIILMLVFGFLFVIGLSALDRKVAIFGLGIPPVIEDYLIMFLSIIGIIKAVVELYRAEHVKKEKNKRDL